MTSSATRRPDALSEALNRAVQAGILSADQAQAVLAAERARGEQQDVLGRRLPVTEALGYLGGLLVLSGAVTLAVEYWLDLPTAGRLALLGAVAIVTWLVGTRIIDPAAPALLRLRGALWFASSMAAAGFAAELAWDIGHVDDAGIALSAGAVGAAHAGLLWWLRDRPAQHLACLAGALVAAGGVGDLVDDAGAIGLAVAGIGAAWAVAGWYRLLPPPTLALLGGATAVLFGTGTTAGSWPDAAPLLGLAAAIALAAVGVGTNRTPLTVAGLLGAFVYLPWTIGHFFADSLGVPLAMVFCGSALLAVTLLLLHSSRSGV
ncbi:MAG: hypothetical protein ACRDTE_06770 [Pseudonocardiaceae bacterium]